ncbi:hypothetical protein DL771_004526 [Monosporascus sp. 5C6A]|nr:hypothetical protein DL771_004526 [Monosporascus sp. 5C6A]
MASRLKRISLHGRRKTPSARDVVFHELPGHLTFLNAMAASGRTSTSIMHPPGLAGFSVIDEVDPALVVLDVFFRPAIHATRKQNRLHAFITPNTLIESFPLEQPYLGWLWNMGSGIPYPIPWSRIPENIYMNLRYFYALLRMPHYRATQKFLESKGLTDRVRWFNLHNPDVPWFSQALPGASTPLDVIPPNVTCTGPMSLSLSTAEEQSPALARWLARSPTVLINLGSLFSWTENHAAAMAHAVADVLRERTDLQVLWKFRKAVVDAEGTTYSDEFASPVHPFLESGRVKMEPWLEVDPTPLLETGHIVASVHHGGAGCYHEALGTGVPQVVLPLWLDHYSFAQLVEDVGIGAWGCRETSPYWTAECLRHALLKVLDGSESGIAMREKARRFGDLAQRDPGQYVAARGIAKLAASGYGS